MKRWSFVIIIFLAVSICCVLVSDRHVGAQPAIKYSCCYQAYESIEKERIEAFTKETGIKVDVSVMSSTSAYKFAINKASDIGSITLKTLSFQHLCQNFVMTPFCQDSIAVIVNSECHTDTISEKQLRDIFSGDIVNWNELGGPDQAILTVVPREGTGAFINFDRLVMKGKKINYQLRTYESTKVIDVVAHLPLSIGFISQAATRDHKGIKALKINNLLPNDKDYPYVQVFYFVSAEEPAGPTKAFVDFAFSEKGMGIIKKKGMTPIPR